MENILNYIVKYRNRLIFIKKKNDIFFTGNEKKNKKKQKNVSSYLGLLVKKKICQMDIDTQV